MKKIEFVLTCPLKALVEMSAFGRLQKEMSKPCVKGLTQVPVRGLVNPPLREQTNLQHLGKTIKTTHHPQGRIQKGGECSDISTKIA